MAAELSLPDEDTDADAESCKFAGTKARALCLAVSTRAESARVRILVTRTVMMENKMKVVKY